MSVNFSECVCVLLHARIVGVYVFACTRPLHIAARECFNSVSDNCRAPSLTRAGTQTEFRGETLLWQERKT